MQKRKRRASVWAVIIAFVCVISSMSMFKVDVKAEGDKITTDGLFIYGKDIYNTDGGYMICGYQGDGGNVVIPSKIDGISVTAIGQYAFNEKNITSLVIPNGVRTIEEGAFYYCKKLAQVALPDSLTAIRDSAFYQCESLTSVVLPDTLSELGAYAFGDCYKLQSFNIPTGITVLKKAVFRCSEITNLTVPSNIKKIEYEAFGLNDKMTVLSLPEGLTELGENALRGLRRVGKIEIPASVTKIGEGALSNCGNATFSVASGNIVYDSRNNCGGVIETATNRLIAGNRNTKIPNTVKTIAKYAYREMSMSASTIYEIPDGVEKIEDDAFYSCSIREIMIPQSVTYIGEGEGQFCYWHVVANKTVLTPDSEFKIYCYENSCAQQYAANHNIKAVLIKPNELYAYEKDTYNENGGYMISNYLGKETDVVVPSKIEGIQVTAIGDRAFASNSYVQSSIKIPEGVTVIGKEAFEWIHAGKISLPNSLRRICTRAFSHCGLSVFEIPYGVETIEDSVFFNCGSLKSLTIPKTVTSIGTQLCYYYQLDSNGKVVLAKNDDLVINCVEGSYAHKYAIENGYKVNLIEDTLTVIKVNAVNLSSETDVNKLKIGDTFQVKGIVLPENATNKGITFYSNNTDIVKIDSVTGVATVVGNGKTYILGNSNDGNASGRLYITVGNSTPGTGPNPDPDPTPTPDVTTRYTTHVQTYGWQGDENNTSKWFTNGRMAGTSGQAKRLEGIKISVSGNVNLGIQYTTHCQSYGWLPWSANGEMNGTEGEAKRLEAIKIQLTGADKEKYDVYYRVHAQSYGWLGWAKNGAPSGTAGYAKRLEGIQIVVLKKGASAPGLNYAGVNAASGVHQAKSYIAKAGSSPVVGNQATSNTNPSVAGERNVNIAYRTHVQTYGWQGWKYNGQMSGTSGQAKRLEGINIKLTNKPYSGSIVYTTHVQTYGWQGNENNQNTWRHDGQMSGTSGEAKRLEAIRINLTGEMAAHYDVYYRVHAQTYGWLNWAKNGEAAGTAGLAKRLEGIQIVLVPKNGKAPATRYQGITSVRTQAYIKK